MYRYMYMYQYMYMYNVYVYMYMCMCICVYVYRGIYLRNRKWLLCFHSLRKHKRESGRFDMHT